MPSLKSVSQAIAVAVFAVLLGSCQDAPLVEPLPTGLTLSVHPAEANVPDGAMRTFETVIRDGMGNQLSLPPSDMQLRWRTTDATVAGVDPQGRVTANRPGSVRIVAELVSKTSMQPIATSEAAVRVTQVAARLAYVGGADQQAQTGQLLPDKLVAAVVDRHGSPVSGVAVTFAVVSGGGQASPSQAMSDAEGRAETQWTLGFGQGEQQVEARAEGLVGSPLVFSATADARPPAILTVVAGNGQTASVNATLVTPLQVEVRDALGNGIRGAAVRWLPASGSGTVHAASSVTDDDGRAATLWTLGGGEGTQTVTATVDGLPGVTFSATASTAGGGSTLPKAAAMVIVAGDGQIGEPGRTLPTPLQIQVRDVNGAPVPAVSVVWETTAGSGRLNKSTTITDNNGLTSALWTLGSTEGTHQASVRATGLPAVTFTATAKTKAVVVDRLLVSPDGATLDFLGATKRLTAQAFDASGQPLAGTQIQWSSLTSAVASVDSMGSVLAHAVGTAIIVASAVCCDSADSVTVVVRQVVSSVAVTPSSASVGAGKTVQLSASARDAGGSTVPNPPFVWASSNEAIAKVNSSGLVTGLATGSATIRASVGGVTGSATVAVSNETSSGEWHRVLSDTTIHGDVIVADGERWLIGPDVQVHGNLRTVGGTIAMRPGSTLKFMGANPASYVGGGMTYDSRFANDIGLWVGPHGALDIQCTPKTAWNRTGVDPTWQPSDEYWITPTDAEDYWPRRWFPGQPIPQVDPRLPGAEVINVTRDCVIEGPAHIHIHSTRPQRIEYVQLRRMGISNAEGPVLGRYALHLHMSGEGTRGTTIQGVAAIESGGTVFVPHASHGITMIDNVAVNSRSDGFWWDSGDQTNDVFVDRLVVAGVEAGNAINNHIGSGNVMRNSVAAGAHGGKTHAGFFWLAGSGAPAIWEFEQGNVAHNNTGPGVRFWTNSKKDHRVANTFTYRNNNGGIESGAYKNAVRYSDMLLFEDHIFQHASSNTHESDGGPARYERVVIESHSGPAIYTQGRNLPPDHPTEFIDCTIVAGPGAPKVLVGRSGAGSPFLAIFRRSGLGPDDVQFEIGEPGVEGSMVVIEHEDGRVWEIKVQGGQRIVTGG